MGKKKKEIAEKPKPKIASKFDNNTSNSDKMNIHDQLENARLQKLNNRLTRGLKQRIQLLNSYYDYSSIRKLNKELYINNEKNKDQSTTYHNDDSCTDSKNCTKLEQNDVSENTLSPKALVRCDKCTTDVIDWVLEIHGSTGNTQKIKSNLNKISCTCIDFNRTKNCCKHILQVFFKVLDNHVELGFDQDQFNLSTSDLKQIYSNLTQKFIEEQKRFNTPVETTEDRQSKNDSCPVCQDILGEEALSMCSKHCKNAFHTECINLWMGRSKLCPMCRNTLVVVSLVIKNDK